MSAPAAGKGPKSFQILARFRFKCQALLAGELGQGVAKITLYLRGFARKVGSAWVGSSGHGCRRYFLRISLRTSA